MPATPGVSNGSSSGGPTGGQTAGQVNSAIATSVEDFAEVGKDTAIPVEKIQGHISELLEGAEINGGVLRFIRQDNENPIDLTLPTGTAMADGVVVSATLDATTSIVSITTSNNDVIAVNLSTLANVGVEFTQIEKTKLGTIEDSATADQDDSEIVAAIDRELDNEDWKTGGTGTGTGLTSVARDSPLTGDGTDSSHLAIDNTALVQQLLGNINSPLAGVVATNNWSFPAEKSCR